MSKIRPRQIAQEGAVNSQVLLWSDAMQAWGPADFVAVKSTIGGGLPSVAARKNGDLHYDTTARKLYTHVGVAGGALTTDDFTAPDGTTITGRTTTTGGKVWEGFGAAIYGNMMRMASSSSYTGYVALDTGGFNNDVTFTATQLGTGDNNGRGGQWQVGLESLGDLGMGNILAPYYVKLEVWDAGGALHVYSPGGWWKPGYLQDTAAGAFASFSLPSGATRPQSWTVRASVSVGGHLRAWFNNSLIFDRVVTEPLAQDKGTHVMFTGAAYYWDGAYYDDVIAGPLGTLEWAETSIDAGNVKFTPIGGISSTTVKAALAELDAEKAAAAHSHGAMGHTILDEATALAQRTKLSFQGEGVTASDDATNDQTIVRISTGATAASGVSFTPTGAIAATDVQAALVELDTEKAAAGHTHGASGTRATVTVASGTNLAAGAHMTGHVALGRGYRLYFFQCDAPCRIRLYTSVAKRDADLSRAATTVPEDNAGVILEYVATAAGTYDLSPAVDGYLNEATLSDQIPVTLTNTSSAAATFSVILTYVRTE